MATHSLASRAAATLAAATPTSTGSCPSFNCSSASELQSLQSNSDISGIGVLLGFAISNYLTLFFCAAYYFINLDGASNPVDRLFLERVSPKSLEKLSKKWSEALESAVLTLGDSQVITGISVLIGGYKQLACGLQYYHWQIVVDLAFFSSITHLTTLTCLRSYFQERPALRLWRLLCMGITAVLLTPALVSTGYINSANTFYVPPNLPAQCFLTGNLVNIANADDNIITYNSVYMVIVMGFLSSSYMIRVVQLFPLAPPVMRRFFRTRPSNIFQRLLISLRHHAISSSSKPSIIFWFVGHRLLLSVYCLLKAAADLYGSLLWEITWLALASVWGTIAVWNDRVNYQTDSAGQSALSDDNTWGFGQVFPLVMLVLPFVSFFEAVYETIFPPVYKGISSAHLSNASNAPHQSINTLSVQGQTQPYHDFHEHRWFRKLILLIYGLTLGLAGNVLWCFPYGDNSFYLKYGFWIVAQPYAAWLGYDLGIVWIFTIASLFLLYAEPTLQSTKTTSPLERLEHHIMSLVGSPRIFSAAWNFLVLVLLGSSAGLGYYIFVYIFAVSSNLDLPILSSRMLV